MKLEISLKPKPVVAPSPRRLVTEEEAFSSTEMTAETTTTTTPPTTKPDTQKETSSTSAGSETHSSQPQSPQTTKQIPHSSSKSAIAMMSDTLTSLPRTSSTVKDDPYLATAQLTKDTTAKVAAAATIRKPITGFPIKFEVQSAPKFAVSVPREVYTGQGISFSVLDSGKPEDDHPGRHAVSRARSEKLQGQQHKVSVVARTSTGTVVPVEVDGYACHITNTVY